MAVRCTPGMEWARYPNSSIFWQTARICSSVACAFITTNMTHLETTKSIVCGRVAANGHGVILNGFQAVKDLARSDCGVLLPAVR